jgi:hypothetical protein
MVIQIFYFKVWVLNFMGNFPYLVLILFKLRHFIGHFTGHLIDIWTLVYLGIYIGLCDFFCFEILWKNTLVTSCHNPNLWLMTKARACKGEAQDGSPRVTFHVPRSVGKCDGMNPHTPKWVPTLGVGIPMDSQIFREQF